MTKTFRTAFRSYDRVKQIGQGGVGRVFEVIGDDGVRRALKILDASDLTSERISRFHNEINFCQQRVHSGIMQVLDVGFIEADNVKIPFYVMPMYPQTLRSAMNDAIEPNRAINILVQAIDAMSAAHARNVSHRDLKPENILLDADGNVVIADFGIAQFKGVDVATLFDTREGTRLANFQYASPEQRVRDGNVDYRTDIYALGLIGHELFTGEVPYGPGAKTVLDVSPKHSFLDPILQSMRQQDPNNRPDLQALLETIRTELATLVKSEIANVVTDVPVIETGNRLGGLIEKAAKLASLHNHESLRKRLANSEEGVQLVRSSFERIKQSIREKSNELNTILPFTVDAKEERGLLEITSPTVSTVPFMRFPYLNVLDTAKLVFKYWRGVADIPGRMFFDKPVEIASVDFIPDFNSDGGVVWGRSNAHYSENEVAELMLEEFIKQIELQLKLT